ncbi:MAG TPA: Hsp70 family protein [Stellaceae bacterium]|nr:Hsp70 family protein [Stellaceae bacterium]
MKLFQIEEPDGSPLEAEGPGVAVGIELSPAKGAAVAVAVGGNAELLPGTNGTARLALPKPSDAAALGALLLALRERAEKALARPVTHAVVASDALDAAARQALDRAAQMAGVTLLRVIAPAEAAALAPGADAADAPALGAAIQAEEDATGLAR